MKLAIIGGTGLDEIPEINSGIALEVATRFGSAYMIETKIGGREVIFLARHGVGHALPPGEIDYRAQIAALKKAGVSRVIGVCAVGSLTRELQPGSFAVLGDFIDMTRSRVGSFFGGPEGPIVHTDFSEPYCQEISDALANSCETEGVAALRSAVYVGVEGPRYESPAEIRLFASWGGHVVGMTNLPEAVLAREAGLCYGAIAVCTNLAAGLSPTPLSHDEVRLAMTSAAEKLKKVLARAIEAISETGHCECRSNARLKL